MWRRQRLLKWKVILLAYILNSFVRQTFSDKSTCDYDWKSVEVLNGHDVSVRFHLSGPILDNQTLVWIVPNTGSMRCNNSLHCTGNDSSMSTRYRLIKALENTTNTFEVIIEPAQEHDSGQHLIIIYEGRDKTCTALIFQLTVVNVDSVCTTRLDKEKEMIQMTCKWKQFNENDYAEFRAGKQVLFEDLTSDNTIDGNLYITHQFSVNIDPENIDAVQYVCYVFREKSNESKSCHFLTDQYQTIEYNQTENQPYKCCATSTNVSATWWNSASGDSLPFTSNSFISNIVFLCIEKSNSSKAMIFKVVSVEFQDRGDGNNLTLAKPPFEIEQHNNSTNELGCEAIIVNITFLSSADFTTTKFYIPTITSRQLVQTTESSTSSVSIQTGVLISVTAVATSAFVLSFSAVFIILCYYNYLRKVKYHLNQNRSTDFLTSSAAEEEDASESRSNEMTSFSSHTPQPSISTNVHEAVSDQLSASLDSCSDRVTMQSSSEDPGKHRTLPVLCEMEDSCPVRSNSIPNFPHGSGCVDANCMGNVFEDKGFGQQDAGHPLLMPTFLENPYSSVDDVKDLTISTKAGNEPSKPTTFLEPPQSSCVPDRARPDGDKISGSSSLRDKPKEMSVEMVAGNLTQPAVQLDAMYAQPDMSRKTKIKGKTSQPISQVSSEGVCGYGASDPREDAFRNTPSASYHLYSTVPTDMYGSDNTAGIFESTCEGDLYMNSSVHRFE